MVFNERSSSREKRTIISSRKKRAAHDAMASFRRLITSPSYQTQARYCTQPLLLACPPPSTLVPHLLPPNGFPQYHPPPSSTLVPHLLPPNGRAFLLLNLFAEITHPLPPSCRRRLHRVQAEVLGLAPSDTSMNTLSLLSGLSNSVNYQGPVVKTSLNFYEHP